MNVKYLIITMFETIVKIVILAAVVIFVFRTSAQAYDFGYRVFADEPMSISGGRTITVGITEDASIKDIAEMLESKGLISDAKLFIVQELLSAHHGEIQPGIYDLSTDMKAETMLEIMSTSAVENAGEDQETGSEEPEESQEPEEEGTELEE